MIPGLAGRYGQPYLTYRPPRLQRLAESIPELLKRLQIRALDRHLKTTGTVFPPPRIIASWFTSTSMLQLQKS
jgi:hypothetical protein